MSLRVIWQYMDRSVTKQFLYGPHILPYDSQCHELLLLIFQNISCILKMRTSSTRYAKGTGLRCSRTVALIVPFFLVCVYGNTKDHKSNGSAATGPPCNDL